MTPRPPHTRSRRAALLAAALLAVHGPAHATPPSRPLAERLAEFDGSIAEALAGRDNHRPLRIAADLLTDRPEHPLAHFAHARALAAADRNAEILPALLQAVRFGWVDFHRIEHDPAFTRFRGTSDHRSFLLAWPAFLDERAATDLDAARQRLGDRYHHRPLPELRVNILSAIGEESLDEAIVDLLRIARFIDEQLFELDPTDPSRPHPWITVLICDQPDFYALVPLLGVGGIYDSDRKHLIARDLGPSLRHEFVHALHWRHMESIGQVHPLWTQEALATLLEDLAPADAATPSRDNPTASAAAIQPSWRTNIARRLARSASLTAWPRLFAMPREDFVGPRARANYAQVRTIAAYIHASGRLGQWYRAVVQHHPADPIGLAAIQATFGTPIRDIEREFRVWARDLPEVAEFSKPGPAQLPFRIAPGPVDGMRVDQPVPAALVSPIDPDRPDTRRLQRGDVILAIDDDPVPTTDDLIRSLGQRQPGTQVRLLVRRADDRFQVAVRLAPRDELDAAW